MVDKNTEVVNESIRRSMKQAMDEVDETQLSMDCPLRELVGAEEVKRLAALGVAMTRIIESTYSN